MRGRHLAISAGGALALTALTAPAANAADTTVTFTVTTGGLSISAQTAANLGSGPVGGTVSGHLGTVRVVDARVPSSGSWTARVSSSTYTDGTTTIPPTDATYDPGTPTLISGSGTLTPGSAGDLGSQRIAMIYTGGGTATSEATWDPNLSIFIPLGSTLGDYTGTVTHSVT